MNILKVLIIEDDSIQARRLEELIHRSYPQVRIDKIATESEFRSKLPDIGHSSYAVALIDMMLRWTDPSPSMEYPPKDVLDEGFFVAGLRCRSSLLERGIPSVIFTVHDREMIPQLKEDGIDFVQKGPSFDPVLSLLKRYLNPPDIQS